MQEQQRTTQTLLVEITDLREQLAAYQERENRQAQANDPHRLTETIFQALAEKSLVGIYMIQDGILQYVNNRFAEIFGYAVEEISGKLRVVDAIFPEDYPSVSENLNRRISGELDALHYEFRILTKKQDIKYVEVYSLRFIHQEKPAVIGTLLDITERKRIQREVEEREQKYRKLYESMMDGFVTMDLNGRFLEINRVFQEMSGYTNIELKGMTYKALTPESWHTYEADIIDHQVLSRGFSDVYEKECRHKDGRIFPVELRTYLLYDAAGQPQGFWAIVRDITERRKSELKIIEYNQLLHSILAASPVGIGKVKNRVISWVNETLCHMSGYSAQEIQGREASLFYENRKEYERVGQLIYEEGLVETQLKRKDGEVRQVSIQISPTDSFSYIFAISDITHQKKNEEALLQSVAENQKAVLRYEALIAASNTGAWEYNHNSGHLWCSPEYFSMIGRDLGDFDLSGKRNIEQIWHDLLHPEDRERATRYFENYLKNPTGMYEQHFRIRHQNGGWVWIWSRGKTLRDKEGNLTNLTVGTHIDITQSKKMEEELRRFGAVIDQAVEELVITDPEGMIQYINPAFEKITGYTCQEALGQNPRILKSGIHDDGFYKQLWDTITGGQVWSGRIVNKRKDGKLIHEDAIISPLFNAEGQCTGFASLKRDVTDRISLENQLRQAQKMEAIGTLAGGIAHDFNNILGSVIGYTELANMTIKDDNVNRYLEQVLQASDRARALVAQILTFSRQSRQEKKPLSVTPIFKEVIKLLRSSIPANIQIRQNFICPYDTIYADPTQIYQVLMNLCTNAAHAMREDGGVLDIILESEKIPADGITYTHDLKEGTYLKLSVRDTGYGMDPSTIEHIFEPFFTTKKEGEGTGLGLSVVYGIVKDHGGNIHVASRSGNGTAFTILLPLIEEAAARKDETAASIPNGRGRILLVDDEDALAQMGREMLTSLGYEVTLRYSSLDALEVFRNKPQDFDLVITDMTMPNMSGAMLARAMLKIRCDLPVILVTGFSERINEEDAKGIGIKEFMMKPVSLANLAQTVRRVLDQNDTTIG